MAWKCKKCGEEFKDEDLQQNGMCIDCFAEDWGEIIESPGGTIVSPKILEDMHDKEK